MRSDKGMASKDEMCTWAVHQIMCNMVKSLQFKKKKVRISKSSLVSTSASFLLSDPLCPSAVSAALTNVPCFAPRVHLSHFILLNILFSSCGPIRTSVWESDINQPCLVFTEDAAEISRFILTWNLKWGKKKMSPGRAFVNPSCFLPVPLLGSFS